MRLSVVETTEPGGLEVEEAAGGKSLQYEVELGVSFFMDEEVAREGPFCNLFCSKGM